MIVVRWLIIDNDDQNGDDNDDDNDEDNDDLEMLIMVIRINN